MFSVLSFHCQAGLCEPDRPEGLLIALEPEAASICCRKLRLNQLVPEKSTEQTELKVKRSSSSTLSLLLEPTGNKLVLEDSREGTIDMCMFLCIEFPMIEN
jgi:hypothetical protein